MAEIPEHLLARSKAKRATISGEGGAETAPAPGDPAAATPAKVAATAAPKAAKIEAPVPASAPPVVKGLLFTKVTKVLLMTGVPVWAFFYAGIFATPKSTVETPAQLGGKIYSSQCAGCHVANGSGSEGGGAGRPLWNGNAEKTFPEIESQIAFVRHGSCATGVPYGNPKHPDGEHVGKGGMPAFPDLTAEQIQYVIEYERTVLSGKEFPVLAEGEVEKTEEELEAEQAKLDITTDGVCGPGRKGF